MQQLTRPALLYDYPWMSLPRFPNKESSIIHIIDLGSGPADAALDLLRLYQPSTDARLTFTLQDLPGVIESTRNTINSTQPSDIIERTVCLPHDYFTPNPSRGSAFFLRGVLRACDDEEAIIILRHVRDAMIASGPCCKLLINEILTGPIGVVPDHALAGGVAPSQFVLNSNDVLGQSAWPELANLMTQSACVVFGGKERSGTEMFALLKSAGLYVEKLWKMRSFIAMVECLVER